MAMRIKVHEAKDYYYFEEGDADLARAFFAEGNSIYAKGLGPSGTEKGEVEHFGIRNARFPADTWNYFGIRDNDIRDELGDEPYWYAEDLKKSYGIDMYKQFGEDEPYVVVFDSPIDQTEQNFLEWVRAYPNLYCDAEAMEEFLKENDELTPKSVIIRKIKELMVNHNITIADLDK